MHETFQKSHNDNFFLFDKFDRWAILLKKKKGGGGGGGEVGARAVWGREGRKWVVARGELG